MFFKQIYRNAAKSRRGNGLFYGSLVIAIIAFYTLLSLGEQDVMRFLATIESDAVKKLLMLLPVVYIISLFFVFFLVYFACNYHVESRRKELGMYLMLGMKRSRMVSLLFIENLWNSLISLLIGLPSALFLTEGISLAMAKVVGLGIVEHKISFSPNAVLWTVCGFVLVQLFCMVRACIPLGKAEPAELLHSRAAAKQKMLSAGKSAAYFVVGILLLLTAYYLGLFQLDGLYALNFLLLIISGIAGTFFLYRGLGGFLGRQIQKKAPDTKGLIVFTHRQIQENVVFEHKPMAIASLLLMIAISCFSYGIAMTAGQNEARTTDFSLFHTDKSSIEKVLSQENAKDMVKSYYPVYLEGIEADYDYSEFISALKKSGASDNIVQRYADENYNFDYLISESSYNGFLHALGKQSISLDKNKIALFSGMGNRGGTELSAVFNKTAKQEPSISINGENYKLMPELYADNIVADRSISLFSAWIVPDSLYKQLVTDTEVYCYNVQLDDAFVEENGLMQAIQTVEAKFSASGIEYDSYLAGIGRNLFYSVSASYLTIYLGVLFLLIANTVIGMKYLINQRQNKGRYKTLLMLGAGTEELCSSVKKQIGSFFSLVLGVSLISSIFAVATLFTNFTKLPSGDNLVTVLILAGIMIAFFTVLELIYITIVKRTACKEIRSLDITDEGGTAI